MYCLSLSGVFLLRIKSLDVSQKKWLSFQESTLITNFQVVNCLVNVCVMELERFWTVLPREVGREERPPWFMIPFAGRQVRKCE